MSSIWCVHVVVGVRFGDCVGIAARCDQFSPRVRSSEAVVKPVADSIASSFFAHGESQPLSVYRICLSIYQWCSEYIIRRVAAIGRGAPPPPNILFFSHSRQTLLLEFNEIQI